MLGNLSGMAQQAAPAKTPPAPATKTQKAPAAKTATTGTTKSSAATALTTQKDKFSYALGMNLGGGLGATLRKQSVEFDPALVAQGMKDAMSGSKTRLTDDEAHAILIEVQNAVRKQQQEKAQQEAAANKKEGDAFLAANKSKEGVVTLPDGLQYKVLKAGTGPKPTTSDTVICNYKGTLVNGTEFDASSKHGGPATFPVGGVIKGWTEALQLMPVGSTWQIVLPSELAYGEHGPPGSGIGANSTLIFEVELISIQDKNAGKEPEKSPEKTDDKAPEKK